jgi:hypothetical protein
LYVADYAGHSFQVNFVGAHPDVVLGDDPANPGVDNYAAIAHVNSSYQQIVSYYWISVLKFNSTLSAF